MANGMEYMPILNAMSGNVIGVQSFLQMKGMQDTIGSSILGYFAKRNELGMQAIASIGKAMFGGTASIVKSLGGLVEVGQALNR